MKENRTLKPLTEGLGLDHFADGLPYAQPKQPRSNKKNLPPHNPLNVALPLPTPSIVHAEHKKAAPMPSLLNEPTQEEALSKQLNGMQQVLIFLLDVGVVTALFLVTLWIAFGVSGFSLSPLQLKQASLEEQMVLVGLYGLSLLSYFFIQWIALKQTLIRAYFA